MPCHRQIGVFFYWYMLNSVGIRHEPCGTPAGIDRVSDAAEFNETKN